MQGGMLLSYPWGSRVWGPPHTGPCHVPGGQGGRQSPRHGCKASLPWCLCLQCPLDDARSVSRGDPQPPVPGCRHRAVGCSTSSGPGASHRALGRPLCSLFNEAPCLIGTGRPAFIKRALAGGGFGDGPDLGMLDLWPDPQSWGGQRETRGHGELWSRPARFGGQGWGLTRGRLTKRRGCTACCAFKKSGGIAAPPLLGNSVCLGKLPAASPGASLLSGRWPCPGPPAVRWPWAPGTPTVAPLAAHRKMPPDLPAAPPGAGGEPLGRQPGGHRYTGCWGQRDAG